MQLGHEGNVDECEVIFSNTELELSHRLDERCGFDVTDGPSELERIVNNREGISSW